MSQSELTAEEMARTLRRNMGIRDMQRKIRALKADIEEAEAAEDLWPCPPNEKRIERFRELLEYYEMDLEALREARKQRAKI